MLIFCPVIILSLLLFGAGHLAAQQSGNEKLDVVRVNTNLVLVPVSVYDRHGARVSGLKSEDFALMFNGASVPITHFTAGTEHVSMVFVLDASGSSQEIISQQEDTALALYSRFGRDSKVAVIRFSDRPEVIVPLTHNIEHVRHAFSFPALRNRKTAIFDAVRKSIELFQSVDPIKNAPAVSAERRIVILISDGLENASLASSADVVRLARQAGVSIYVIHLPVFVPDEGRLRPRQPAKGFKELAEKTGGRFFTFDDVRLALDPRAEYDLSKIFAAIDDDLKGQYVLGFYPAESFSRADKTEVRLTIPSKRVLHIQKLN